MTKKTHSEAHEKKFHVAIVGAGLVGSLTAIYCAQRGWKVTIIEARKDLRRDDTGGGRSINLAMSCRAFTALEGAKMANLMSDCLIPMKGRMLHSIDGKLTSQAYGRSDEFINSVDRKKLNSQLLNAAEKFSSVSVYFDTSVKECILDEKRLVLQRKDGSAPRQEAFDFIFGCDGAYSRCRREIMRRTRMNYSQYYIDHGYVELSIPPTSDGQFAMDPNHLHIWPRHTFMLIALPNLDKSFTVTLFVTFKQFGAIETNADLVNFFKTHFPDALELIGADTLCSDFFKHTHGSLISVKCEPYHYQSACVVLGDAAHAMVPFYGQGMNAGFEDVRILFEMLDRECASVVAGTVQPVSPALTALSPQSTGVPSSPSFRATKSLEAHSVRAAFDNKSLHYNPSSKQLTRVLETYSKERHNDAAAVCDLAMHNYTEMRHSVTTFGYKLRKTVDWVLSAAFPSKWIPLYSMVSFTNVPYSQVIIRNEKQTRLLGKAGLLLNAALIGLCIVAGKHLYRKM